MTRENQLSARLAIHCRPPAAVVWPSGAEHPRPGIEYPSNWHELLAWFPDDAACLRYLERMRWGSGFTCRFCGSVGGGWWQMADGL